VLTYRRKHDRQEVVVILNFTNAERIVAVPDAAQMPFSTTLRQAKIDGQKILLMPNEGVVLLNEPP
jgi:hypothetical protein